MGVPLFCETTIYIFMVWHTFVLLAQTLSMVRTRTSFIVHWGFPGIRGTIFGGPYNKDYSNLGIYTGVPLFWETTITGPTTSNQSLIPFIG